MLPFLARQDGLQRLHVALNLRSDFVLGNSQVVARLEIHPERRAVLEIACETRRGIGSDSAPLVDDVGDPGHWDAQIHGHPVHAQPERIHELLSEDLPGMYRLPSLGHASLLVIVRDFDFVRVTIVALAPVQSTWNLFREGRYSLFVRASTAV